MIGAIDIGGTKIAVGMVDDRGRVRSKMEIPTGRDSSYPTSLRQIGEMLRKTAQEAGVKITGIGIGSTGPVDPFSGEFGEVDFLPDWRHKNRYKTWRASSK